jgi:hypothetical protein
MICAFCGEDAVDLTVPWPDDRCREVCADPICLEVAEERRIEFEGRLIIQAQNRGGNHGEQ